MVCFPHDNLSRVESEMIFQSDAVVAEWLCNEVFDTDEIPELAERGNDGVLQGDASISNGVLDVGGTDAVMVDVDTDDADVALHLKDSDFTISLRVYFDNLAATGTWVHFLTKYQSPTDYDFTLFINSDERLYLKTSDSGGDSFAYSDTGAIAAGCWYDLVIT